MMRLIAERYGELDVRGTGEEDEVGRLERDAPVHWQIDYMDIKGSKKRRRLISLTLSYKAH